MPSSGDDSSAQQDLQPAIDDLFMHANADVEDKSMADSTSQKELSNREGQDTDRKLLRAKPRLLWSITYGQLNRDLPDIASSAATPPATTTATSESDTPASTPSTEENCSSEPEIANTDATSVPTGTDNTSTTATSAADISTGCSSSSVGSLLENGQTMESNTAAGGGRVPWPNAIITPLPTSSLDYGTVVTFVKSEFKRLWPEDEFLPAAPNPDDISFMQEQDEGINGFVPPKDNEDDDATASESIPATSEEGVSCPALSGEECNELAAQDSSPVITEPSRDAPYFCVLGEQHKLEEELRSDVPAKLMESAADAIEQSSGDALSAALAEESGRAVKEGLTGDDNIPTAASADSKSSLRKQAKERTTSGGSSKNGSTRTHRSSQGQAIPQSFL